MSFKDWYCSRCSLQFDKKVIFDMHLSIVHKEIVEIKESITFKDEPNLDTEKVLLMCDICDSKFETQITLNKHIDSQHVKNKTLKCEICDYTCPKKITLKKHTESVHQQKKPFKCEIFEYSCSRKNIL